MSSKKDFAAYLLGEGINYRSYDYMGSHRAENGYVFRVCAPDADRAFLVGDFNGWGDDIPLRRISASGIWEGFAHSHKIAAGDKYKYRIHKGDDVFYLPDPYSTHAATTPETASLIPCDDDYAWNDGGWMSFRKKYAFESYRLPMNVYGIHLASWKRYSDGAPLELDKLAAELAPYVKQMGYTHIELVPHRSAECFDDAFFSPESLYGVSGCLKAFVDHMHMAGIGVIFDLDMSRFFKNRYVYASYSGYTLVATK
jgi:1,4-alpha-glucan branching enzyme